MAVLVTVFLGVISYFVWQAFAPQLIGMLRWIRLAELSLVGLIFGNDYVWGSNPAARPVGVWKAWLGRAPVEMITLDHVKAMTSLAVLPLRPFFTVGIFAMAAYVTLYGHRSMYRRKLNLERLMAEQAKSFPAIQPFIKFDPRQMPARAPGAPVPAKLPLFAEALTPEEWIAFHDIRVTSGGQVDRPRAQFALIQQLGPRWEGPSKLPMFAQGLFAAFALKHVRKRKEAEDMLSALAMSWSHDKGFRPSFKLRRQIKRVLKDPKLGGALKKHADKHAFETTAMLRSLARAREEGGVLAPAQFLWLRGVDRRLWYALNNLGRKAYHAEAAGAMVHYVNELIAGQKIPVPRFEDAITTLENFLKAPGGARIPPKEKSKRADK